jgi:hypothetical protein
VQRGNPIVSGALHILERIPVRLKHLGLYRIVAGLVPATSIIFLRA